MGFGIMVMGAGGIGGYLAGRLCGVCGGVTLVARGAQLAAIQRDGLTLVDRGEKTVVHPARVTDKPAETGVADAILLCVKGYSLASALDSVAPCVGPDTLIIPTLNGINTHRRIRERLPAGIAADGCIYVFSRVTAPGVVEKTGDVSRFLIGIPGKTAAQSPQSLLTLCDLINRAGVETVIPDDIVKETWMKWTFNCASAQATSYFDVPLGRLREDPEKLQFFLGLLDEILLMAKAEGVGLPADFRQRNVDSLNTMPYEGTSSLSRDLAVPGKPTELDLLCGEMRRLSEKHGIPVPYNTRVFERFRDRL